MFVFGGVHGAAEGIGGFPEFFLVTDVGLGVRVALLPGGWAGHRSESWLRAKVWCTIYCRPEIESVRGNLAFPIEMLEHTQRFAFAGGTPCSPGC